MGLVEPHPAGVIPQEEHRVRDDPIRSAGIFEIEGGESPQLVPEYGGLAHLAGPQQKYDRKLLEIRQGHDPQMPLEVGESHGAKVP